MKQLEYLIFNIKGIRWFYAVFTISNVNAEWTTKGEYKETPVIDSTKLHDIFSIPPITYDKSKKKGEFKFDVFLKNALKNAPGQFNITVSVNNSEQIIYEKMWCRSAFEHNIENFKSEVISSLEKRFYSYIEDEQYQTLVDNSALKALEVCSEIEKSHSAK